MNERKCSIEGCEKNHLAKGYCAKHYRRNRLYGNPHQVHCKTAPGEALEYFFRMIKSPPANECLIWPYGKSPHGYGNVFFYGAKWSCHRLALMLYTGIDPEGLHAAHGDCHNPNCFNPHPDHGMRWTTPKENSKDRHRDGTAHQGENVNGSVLTKVKVMMIYKDPRRMREIEDSLGVKYSTIYAVKNGYSWAWLTGHQRD